MEHTPFATQIADCIFTRLLALRKGVPDIFIMSLLFPDFSSVPEEVVADTLLQMLNKGVLQALPYFPTLPNSKALIFATPILMLEASNDCAEASTAQDKPIVEPVNISTSNIVKLFSGD